MNDQTLPHCKTLQYEMHNVGHCTTGGGFA